MFLSLFEIISDVLNRLNYCGYLEGDSVRECTYTLDAMNQCFLTLIKLCLNSKIEDLATDLVFLIVTSQYVTTWICFLYHHFNELVWMSTVN